jgi:hypothetical protein
VALVEKLSDAPLLTARAATRFPSTFATDAYCPELNWLEGNAPPVVYP